MCSTILTPLHVLAHLILTKTLGKMDHHYAISQMGKLSNRKVMQLAQGQKTSK